MAQKVKSLPAKWKVQVQPLGLEGPLETEMAHHASSCLEKSHGQRSLVGKSP